jgi:hypothetical protein
MCQNVTPVEESKLLPASPPMPDLLGEPQHFSPCPERPSHRLRALAPDPRSTRAAGEPWPPAPSPAAVTAPRRAHAHIARTRWTAEPTGPSCCWAAPSGVRPQWSTGHHAERLTPRDGFDPCAVYPFSFFLFI